MIAALECKCTLLWSKRTPLNSKPLHLFWIGCTYFESAASAVNFRCFNGLRPQMWVTSCCSTVVKFEESVTIFKENLQTITTLSKLDTDSWWQCLVCSYWDNGWVCTTSMASPLQANLLYFLIRLHILHLYTCVVYMTYIIQICNGKSKSSIIITI